MSFYVLLFIPVVLIIGIVIAAARRQAARTEKVTREQRQQDARALERSKAVMEATVAEELARKARDPRLATLTEEDLVYEVLKECYDPEIPLNIVDLGLVYEVKVQPEAINIKMSMTSPMCPSHVQIREDVKTKLSEAGFANPTIDLVWEPAWSPHRISEAGKKKLGLTDEPARS